MSQRHRTDRRACRRPKEELRAHAHSERHRIHVELQAVANQVSAGLDPPTCHEPGAAWEPVAPPRPRGRPGEGAKREPRQRHWKMKMWKRRTATARQGDAMRLDGELNRLAVAER